MEYVGENGRWDEDAEVVQAFIAGVVLSKNYTQQQPYHVLEG